MSAMNDELVLVCNECDLATKFNSGGPGPALINSMKAQHRKKVPTCSSSVLWLRLHIGNVPDNTKTMRKR